jgi:inosose dehydratase
MNLDHHTVQPVSKKIENSQVSRRCFLATAAATGSGLLSFRGFCSAEDAPADPLAGFKLGVQSFCYHRFDAEHAIKKIHELGLRYVEMFPGHFPGPRVGENQDGIKKTLELCKKYEVEVHTFGVERFTSDHEANRKVFDFARAMGIKVLTCDPEPDSFDSLDKLVEEFKIPVAIHNHGPIGETGNKLHRWYRAEIILDAVRNHHPLIGTCLDTGHLIRMGRAPFKLELDPVQQIRAMGKRNFAIHLKDHDVGTGVNVNYGKGRLDVVAVLKALRGLEFAGPVSIEHEAHPGEPDADMKACVDDFKAAAAAL